MRAARQCRPVRTRAIVAAPGEGGFACVEQRPPSPGPGELVVALGAAGICRTDLFAARGRLPVRAGRVLGHEAAGTVVGGDPARLGQRVVLIPTQPCGRCARCARPGARPWSCVAPAFFGLDVDGVFADRFVAPAHLLLPVPDSLGWREAAFVEPLAAAMAVLSALPEAGSIAVHGDGRIARLTARVVEAATGRPCPILGVAPERERDRYAAVVETTTADLGAALDALEPGGLLIAKSRPATPAALDWRALVKKELRVQAVGYAPFEDAIAWLASRRVPVEDLFGPSFSLDSAAEAFARAEAGEDLKLFLSCG